MMATADERQRASDEVQWRWPANVVAEEVADDKW
jgi:hypothetical protein